MLQVLVWDIATRLFHWLLVLFVVICLITGEDEGFIFAIHAYAGFVILMLLFFRTGWGIFGSRHSRFTDFVYSWPTTWRYALSVFRFKPTRYVGHNPLGGWMIICMLVVLMATTLSGILMVTKGAGWLEDIHEALGTFIQFLVFVHIVGVFVDQFLTGEKIVIAMITGHKALAEDAAQREVLVTGAGKALAFAAIVVISSVYLFQQIDYSTKVATFSNNHESEQDRNKDKD